MVADGALAVDPAVADAIAIIEECRASHVEWAAFVRDKPEQALVAAPMVDVAGTADYHDQWVAKYDRVLSVLAGSRVRDAGVLELQAAVRRHGFDLDAYRSLGDIRAVASDDCILFTYTDKAQYADRWNAVERAARGLVLRSDGAVLALPFPKFFNLGQQQAPSLADLPSGPIEIADKLDGSLIIAWWHETWNFTTRGSFDSEQARWAAGYARTHLNLRALNYSNLTLLFEAIYPGNRIVVNYGDRAGLVLIGARDRTTGHDLSYGELAFYGKALGVPLAPVVTAPALSHLDDLAERALRETGIEGWVARFADGTRVKIKTAEYRRLHKLISHLTPASVRDALMADTLDDLIGRVPDEFLPDVKAMAEEIDNRARGTAVLSAVRHEHALALATDRKSYALAVKEHPDTMHLCFALYDGKPIREQVLKSVDLTGIAELGASISSVQQRLEG